MKQKQKKKPKRKSKKLWKKTLACGMVLVAVLPIFSGLVPQKQTTQMDPKLVQAYLEAMAEQDAQDVQTPQIEGVFELIKVSDNASLTVLYEGKEETARLIGIEDFQEETQEDLQMLLTDDYVELEFDDVKRDEDGSLLVYAYLENGSFLNEELLRNGWAKLKVETENTRYQELLEQAQAAAKEQRIGLWE